MGFDLDNEELIATRKQLKTYINNNYVSKEKIKNEIKELKEHIDGDDYWKYTTQEYIGMQYQVKILKKLLED